MMSTQQQSFRFTASSEPPPPERRNLVIEAGAGTGKTTAIVAEVLRLLLSDENLNPERIVLVTFTEKAAGEIADRVHSALTEIDIDRSANIRWPIGSDKPLLEMAATDAVRRACARQLQHIEKLHSQTIHSFCQTLLRQHALEAGIDPQFRVIEGFERARFYGDVYDTWIDQETRVHPTPAIVREWEDLLDDADYLFLARNRIFALIERRDLLLDSGYTLGDISEMEPQLEEAIKIVRRCGKESEIADYFRATTAPKSGSGMEAWIEYFAPVAEAIRSEDLHRDACDFGLRVLRMSQKKKGDSIYDALVRHRASVALLSLTRRFIARLDAEKHAKSVADFDDLLIQTLTLLENENVLERVRQQFDFIFVDEFQDTDRIQARIIDRLGRDSSGGHVAGKTIVVGDPKQSIYGFRRADPELYAKTTQTLINGGAERRVLRAQYRSEPALLEAINILTKKVLEGGERDRNVFRPEFHELVAARKKEHDDDAPITILASDIEEGESRLTREAEVIADWIAGAPDYRRYALLFRRMTQIDAFLDVFDARNIPYVLPPTRQFLDRPAPVDLLAVLRAIAYPTDLGGEVSAARTPYFALTDSEIVARGDAYASFTAAINSFREIAKHLTVTELIDRVVASTDIEALYAVAADGGRALRHLDHLRSIAFAFDQSSGGSVRQFVDEITRRREEPDEVEPALFDETKNAVRILTIHGSKGLEFETVILPDLLVPPRSPDVMTIEEPASLVVYGNLAGYARKSGDRCLHEIGGLREDAENRRIFYVAVTRAKRDVAFVLAPGAKKSGFSKYLQEALGPLDESMWPAETGRDLRIIDGITIAFERTAARGEKQTRKKLSVDVPAELTECADRLHPVDGLKPLPSHRRAQTAAVQAGILLHRVLERWDGKSNVDDLLRRIAAELGVEPTRVAGRLAIVKQSAMLRRIASAETVGREMPVSILENGVVLNKRIDRVIREAGGDTVIDYKSGAPSEERLAGDRQQVALYCSAMERLTGRPHRGVLWYIDDERDVAIDLQ